MVMEINPFILSSDTLHRHGVPGLRLSVCLRTAAFAAFMENRGKSAVLVDWMKISVYNVMSIIV